MPGRKWIRDATNGVSRLRAAPTVAVHEGAGMTRTVARAIATAMLAGGLLVAVPGQVMAARSFSTCRAMHRVYPHGVGRYGAHDRTSSTPVTNVKRSNALYYANMKSDRDADRVACEAR